MKKASIAMTIAGKTLVEKRIHKKQKGPARAIKEKMSEAEKEKLRQAIGILTKLAD